MHSVLFVAMIPPHICNEVMQVTHCVAIVSHMLNVVSVINTGYHICTL